MGSGYRPDTLNGYVAQTKLLLLLKNQKYNRLTELLHFQLMRKRRNYAISNYSHPISDKPLYLCGNGYNIKAPSYNPYNYDSYNDLGLNQLFVGQSPYKPYQGDIGDDTGIYHDTCDIIPKKYICHNLASDCSDINKDFFTARFVSDNLIIYFAMPDFSIPKGIRFGVIDLSQDIRRSVSEFSIAHQMLDNSNYYFIATITTYFSYKIYEAKENGEFEFVQNRTGSDSDYYANAYFNKFFDCDIDSIFDKIVPNRYSISEDYGDYFGHIYCDGYLCNKKYITIPTDMSFAPYFNIPTDITAKFRLRDPQNPPLPRIKTGNSLGYPISYNRVKISDIKNVYRYDYKLNDGRYLQCTQTLLRYYHPAANAMAFQGLGRHFYIYEPFYAENNYPVRGNVKFACEWEAHWALDSRNHSSTWSFILPGIFFMVGYIITVVSLGTLSQVGIAFMATSMTAIGGVLAGLGIMIGAVGAESGRARNLSKGLGIAGMVTGVLGGISGFFSSFTSSTAASSASSLSATTTASNQGLATSSNAYLSSAGGNLTMNASANGATLGSSTIFSGSNSVVFANNSFSSVISSSGVTTFQTSSTSWSVGLTSTGEQFVSSSASYNLGGGISFSGESYAINGVGSGVTNFGLGVVSNSSFGGFELSQAFDLGIKAYKAYSDCKELFKKPNQFIDDEMPTNNDERPNPLNIDENGFKKFRFWSMDSDYDLGLEPGTLLYLEKRNLVISNQI